MSMMDLKMVSIVQGDGGAYCHYCYSTKKEGNDLSIILEGFNINKELAELEEIWQLLDAGEMKYDDEGRAGMTKAPLNSRGLLFYGILHYKLRVLDHSLKILYHLVGNKRVWSESDLEVKQAVADAKKVVIDHIKGSCTFLINVCNLFFRQLLENVFFLLQICFSPISPIREFLSKIVIYCVNLTKSTQQK